MDISKILQEHIVKAKQYIKLQDAGVSQMEAAYRTYGTDIGDTIVKLQQSEPNKNPINKPINNN